MARYDQAPVVSIQGRDVEVWQGYRAIREELAKRIAHRTKTVLTIECYPAVRRDEVLAGLSALPLALVVDAEKAALDPAEITDKMSPYLTEDRVFGYMSPLNIHDVYDVEKLDQLRQRVDEVQSGLVIVIGFGASLVTKGDVLVYADLARWEIQQRYRSGEFGNWRAANQKEDMLRKYKRGYFVEWRMADRLKRSLLGEADYYLDTNVRNDPKMLTRAALFDGLRQTVARPFRLVPYFDPGVWGGHWLEENIGLTPKDAPYAWGFDGVPEENSLYFQYGDIRVELPSINLVFFEPKSLLGEKVYARFGAEFPIRFDFLDTMGGQNLSLQVHPSTDYIKETFGMHYTQDESYYMLDAGEDAVVYLGLKAGVEPEAMLEDLELAQQGEQSFPAEAYVNVFAAKAHDHFLIPAGTVHCSGANSMVLEISATPYIFTFKLWDWDRLGLDGKPRPIHLAHGRQNIAWDRTTDWVKDNLVSRVEVVAEGEGWREERTGLHALQFIETRRHWFTQPVLHHTEDVVNVLNLVAGDEVVVESPTGAFAPFVVHYAETFIIPAAVGAYTVRPTSSALQKPYATIKAFVRT